jgi:hypothetical protein
VDSLANFIKLAKVGFYDGLHFRGGGIAVAATVAAQDRFARGGGIGWGRLR